MNVLVVYYSYEGNTKAVAEAMAQEVNADLLRLEPKTEKKRRGLMKYVWGGAQVWSGKQPALEPFAVDPLAYDALLIGTPVWAQTFAPALHSFFFRTPLRGKQVGLFACCTAKPGGVFAKMQRALRGNDILGHVTFYDPLTRDADAQLKKARDWAREMVSGDKAGR